jgi:DNA-binding CsgD family transcriptional regulator
MSLSIHQKLITLATQQPNCSAGVIQLISTLTEQELKVLIYLADDLTAPAIAKKLRITPKTIANHKGRMADKLHLDGCRTLRRFAIQQQELLQLLKPDDEKTTQKTT